MNLAVSDIRTLSTSSSVPFKNFVVSTAYVRAVLDGYNCRFFLAAILVIAEEEDFVRDLGVC
jgi:hypothetical protein